jgi:hypothetical protein
MGDRVAMETDAANRRLMTAIQVFFLIAAAAGFLDSCGIGSALSTVVERVAGLVGG